MDFDGLDDILEDNSYVPSFAPKEMKRVNSVKDKFAPVKNEKTIENQSVPVNFNNNTNSNRSSGLFGVHKQSSKKQPTTFQEFFSKEKQPEKKSVSIEKNKSVAHFYNPSTSQKQDDADSIFSAQRTATRRPISKQRQIEKQSQSETPVVPRRGMMPPLNKKNQAPGRKQFTEKLDTNNSMDINENLNITKPVMPKFKDDLDPLEALNKQEAEKMKKFLEQQILYQKKTLESMLEEERQAKKRQIQSMKKVHEEQLKKKLELKDYEISKLKQFYEMQLNLKTTMNAQKKQLSTTSSKIDENLKQLKKIETRINQQYSIFQNKQLNEGNMQFQRKEALLQRRQRELNDLEKRLQQMEKDLKSQKSRIYQEHERQRNSLSEMTIKLNQREHEFQSKFKRKQKDLTEEYQKKRIQLDHEKEKMRYQTIEVQQKKLQVQEQQRQLKKKLKGFEQRQKQILEQLHIQRTKQMQKQIQMSSRSTELSMKQNQVEMERQELINKMKILELERKKLEIEAKGSIKSAFNNMESSIDKGYSFTRNRDPRPNTSGNFESYHKTISQMRDEMMKSMPKF